MATLTEIHDLFSDPAITKKVRAALVIAANNLLDGSPTTAQKAYAAAVFSDPISEAEKATLAVLAANADSTVVQIRGASDSAIQNNVNAVIQTLVDAKAGA